MRRIGCAIAQPVIVQAIRIRVILAAPVLLSAAVAPLEPAKHPAAAALMRVAFRLLNRVAMSDDTPAVCFNPELLDVFSHVMLHLVVNRC